MTSPKPVIDAVDFFYLSMPHINLDVDGSQDALLVRVRSRNDEGWVSVKLHPYHQSQLSFARPLMGPAYPLPMRSSAPL